MRNALERVGSAMSLTYAAPKSLCYLKFKLLASGRIAIGMFKPTDAR